MTDRQCPSCGGFCRKSGCERENVEPELTPAELRCGIALQLREIERLRERVTVLEDALREAADDIEEWGSYASDYFIKKWDLAGDVAKARAALEASK